MDPTRFDALTKRLATRGASRCGLLRGLGGGLLGAVLGAGWDPPRSGEPPAATALAVESPRQHALPQEESHGGGSV